MIDSRALPVIGQPVRLWLQMASSAQDGSHCFYSGRKWRRVVHLYLFAVLGLMDVTGITGSSYTCMEVVLLDIIAVKVIR